MLYIVNEMTFNGYNAYSLDLLYLVAILLGILVIISKNPIVSVLFLIGLFLCISVYLILTGLNFIGLSYLLVYIGAVVVRINKFAALVRIQLYKLLLIINNFLFRKMFSKNKKELKA
jgi:NADH-ubiquinone oxidoreductase chain 6